MTTTANDQIRKLKNSIHFAGALAELEPIKEGVTKEGIAYISLRGVIQCGPTPVYCREFRSFIKAQNAKGEDSQQYKNAKEWYAKAVPMTKDKENPTMVDMVGSVSVNDYVGQDGKLHETLQYTVQFFNDFSDYACDIDIEAYIKSVTDEERGQEDDKHPTGRKRLNLYSMDFYHNIINIKSAIVPNDLVGSVEDSEWEAGRTALIYLSYKPNSAAEVKPTRRGFGEQRTTTSGNNYLELVVVGGQEAYTEDSKDSIAPATANLMMKERASHLAEVEAKGYQGKGGNAASSTNRNGFGTASGKTGSFAPVEPLSDDDIPF